jgi:hypothetical protein
MALAPAVNQQCSAPAGLVGITATACGPLVAAFAPSGLRWGELWELSDPVF